MAYAVGGISGGHFNPAVSLGLAIGGRFAWKELVPYWIAQIAGAIVAAAALYAIASGKAGFAAGGFASNGFGELSPGGYSMQAALLIEIVLTAGFLIVILGSTSNAVPAGFAPIAIGLALTLIHLISIPVTNTSVNPARSTGAALFAETGVLSRNRRKFRQPINVACPAPGRWGRPNSRVTSRHFDHGNASRTSRPDCSGLDEAD